MKKLTRKTTLVLGMCLLMVSSTFAMYDGEVIENNCNLSFNFFGIVRKWTGYKLIKTTDENGWTVIKQVGCGEGGGYWDWFWE